MVRPDLVRQGAERRTKVLAFVREYVGEKGYAPNLTEITHAVGLTGTDGVRTHLRTLQDEGYLNVQPKVARAITLTSPAPDGWTK